MTEKRPEEPKIVVDEDWKERVQREKEAAEAAKQARAGQPDAAGAKPAAGPLPPASFASLVSSLAAQAMMALGQVPDPAEGHPVVRPDVARHAIDTLGVLEEKTKGNLTPEEAKMLDSVLHELRMLFVTVSKPPAGGAPAQEAAN